MSNRDEMPMTTSSQGKIAKPSGLGDAPDHVVPEPTEAMVEAGVKRINATANLGHTIEERIALAAEATIAAAPPEWLLNAALTPEQLLALAIIKADPQDLKPEYHAAHESARALCAEAYKPEAKLSRALRGDEG